MFSAALGQCDSWACAHLAILPVHNELSTEIQSTFLEIVPSDGQSYLCLLSIVLIKMN